MRILLITETVPYPLDSGGRIKTWHTLEALGREHEVHLHAFVRSGSSVMPRLARCPVSALPSPSISFPAASRERPCTWRAASRVAFRSQSFVTIRRA
jgi:hypothetical protein